MKRLGSVLLAAYGLLLRQLGRSASDIANAQVLDVGDQLHETEHSCIVDVGEELLVRVRRHVAPQYKALNFCADFGVSSEEGDNVVESGDFVGNQTSTKEVLE